MISAYLSHLKDNKTTYNENPAFGSPTTSHACYHTYVSQTLALGVDLATIQSIVGHADVGMTQHYFHIRESIRQDAFPRFSKAFTPETTDPDKPTDGACKVVPFLRVG